MESATHVQNLLHVFEKAFGQQVNIDKSSIIFSNNVCNSLKEELCHHLGFNEAGENSMYLGLPNFLHRKKSVAFGFIKEKLQEKLQGWDKKKLSRGGKETLIKSVAQTLPNYTMSVFLLPLEICKDLERAMCKFWWNTNPNKERSIHWMSWEIMSARKNDGGIGFRNVRDFNIALLGKQTWMLLQNPDKLVSRVFKARYYPSESFLTANVLCPVCNDDMESILHTLVLCPFATKCWSTSALPRVTDEFSSYEDWLSIIFEQCNTESISASVMFCWMLWKNIRNDLVWNQKCSTFSEVVFTAFSVLNQWKYVQDKTFDNSLGILSPEDGRAKWQAPMIDRVKVNTDATLFDNLNRYSHAQVVRDHEGNLIEASSKCYQGTISPDMTEYLGIREALSWVKKEKKKDVIIETDCLSVIQWIRSSYSTLSYLGRLVEECRHLLIGLQNQNVMLRFVRRSANGVARYLERYSSSIADRSWRMDNAHPEFISVLCNDLK